ncbi:MAG: helix-turn-helix domain-containing protein [Candidatus Heimdallarchaeota archaeon]|nr:helix-turn-helix domain-containing protein [Candidatus Heimdallarchaeota archaeon]
MTFEIRIRAQHDCPFLEFSKLFGNKQIYGYCSRENDVMILPGHNDNIIEIGKDFFNHTDKWRIINSGVTQKLTYVVMDCECDDLYENSITYSIQRAGGLVNYPIRYQDGWEFHKITCIDEKVVKNVLKVLTSLPKMEVIAIDDLGENGIFRSQMISVPEVISDLTSRQVEILVKAYEEGYYEIPRRIRTQDLADEAGISRYGIEKLLRKAENKIIRSIMPYLYFRHEQYTFVKPQEIR